MSDAIPQNTVGNIVIFDCINDRVNAFYSGSDEEEENSVLCTQLNITSNLQYVDHLFDIDNSCILIKPKDNDWEPLKNDSHSQIEEYFDSTKYNLTSINQINGIKHEIAGSIKLSEKVFYIIDIQGKNHIINSEFLSSLDKYTFFYDNHKNNLTE